MASQNPQIYYENDENHGNYQFVKFEDIVNNFMMNYTGDDTLLGPIKRHKAIYQLKQGVRELNFTTLRRVKAIELELGDVLDVILPPDYVNYVRVSWVNEQTGEIMTFIQNKLTPLGVAYLQDDEAYVMFDHEGEILQGTTKIEFLNDSRTIPSNASGTAVLSTDSFTGMTPFDYNQQWNMDTSKNSNGYFNIDEKRMHFSSDNAPRVIFLEYISDGIEMNEADISVHKLAERALYAFAHHHLAQNSIRIPDYEKRRLKREYDTLIHNSKVQLLGIHPQEFMQSLKAVKTWLR